MKNWIKHLPLLALIFVSLSYTACTSENADEPTPATPSTPSESPEDNLPDEARAFVGYWVAENYSFIFFEDGFCDSSENYWTYNPETSILATTYGSWQWEVTLSNTDAWAGISINSNKAMSFRRGENIEYIRTILYDYTWKGSDGNTLRVDESGNFVIVGTYYEIEISEDDNPNDYTINYELVHYEKAGIGHRKYSHGSGTITMLNPMKFTDFKFVFTGPIDTTLLRVENE